MPIYEFACPKCRRIFNFLSKRMNPERLPVCPKCGNKKMEKQLSRFAMTKPTADVHDDHVVGSEPGFDDARMGRALAEMERDMAHMDENKPKHMAQMMRKMKDLLPPGSVPKDLATAIKRLEAGEDPEKIEADMAAGLGDLVGGEGGGASGGGFQAGATPYGFSRWGAGVMRRTKPFTIPDVGRREMHAVRAPTGSGDHRRHCGTGSPRRGFANCRNPHRSSGNARDAIVPGSAGESPRHGVCKPRPAA